MFSGLSKIIKNILPKQLFYRGLLIVALPIIISQITISVVFFDSLWIKTNKGMTRALVAEIKTFIDAYDNDETNKDFIVILFKNHLEINIKYEKDKLRSYKKLEDYGDRAAGKSQYTAAINAEFRKGQMAGFYVDRREVKHLGLEGMSREALEKRLSELEEKIGEAKNIINITPETISK